MILVPDDPKCSNTSSMTTPFLDPVKQTKRKNLLKVVSIIKTRLMLTIHATMDESRFQLLDFVELSLLVNC